MTVTTAPVKSFDSLRECASNDRVTTKRKPRLARTLARMMMMSQIKVVVAPVTRTGIVRWQKAYTVTHVATQNSLDSPRRNSQQKKDPALIGLSLCLCGEDSPQPHDLMFRTRILRRLNQAVDQLRSVLREEVQPRDLPLLQRFVQI